MKKIYIIGYDKKEGQNYEPLISAIKEIGGVKLLESTFILKSNLTAHQITNQLEDYLDKGNKIVVAEITENSDWLGYTTDASNKLRKFIS